MEPKFIVITGAFGFLGCHLVRGATSRGLHVLAVGRKPPTDAVRRFLAAAGDLVEYQVLDITSREWADGLARSRVLAVINAAAVTPVGQQRESELAGQAAAVNVVGAANVAEWACRTSAGRLIQLSSGEVYGPVAAVDEVTEDHRPQPGSVYGITKLAGEQLARRLCQLASLSIAVTRLTNVFGPLEQPGESRPDTSDISIWCRAALVGNPLNVAAPFRRRDFVFVTDAARAILDLAVTPTLEFDTYNVSPGVAISDSELATLIASSIPGSQVIHGRSDDPGYRPPLSNKRLAAAGWRPETDIAEGIRRYVHWLGT